MRRLRGWLAVLMLGTALAQPPQPEPRAGIPFKPEATGSVDAGRIATGFIVAVVLGLGVLVLLRRRLGGGLRPAGSRRVRVLETLRVTPRTTLLLLEFDGETLLLAEQAGSVVLLSRPVAAQPPGARGEGGEARGA